MDPVIFGTLTVFMTTEVVFGCVTTIDYFISWTTSLEECFSLVRELVAELRITYPSCLPAQHLHDPVPPWRTFELLSRRCQKIINDLTPTFVKLSSDPKSISWLIQWQPPSMSCHRELFSGVGIRLVAILEAGLTIQRYIYVDSVFLPCKTANTTPCVSLWFFFLCYVKVGTS